MSAPFSEFGPFAVGEICRIVSAKYFPELIGREVTIAGPRQRATDARTGEPYEGYPVGMNYKGYCLIARESCLRRRKPPASHTGERMFMQQLRDLTDRLRESEPA